MTNVNVKELEEKKMEGKKECVYVLREEYPEVPDKFRIFRNKADAVNAAAKELSWFLLEYDPAYRFGNFKDLKWFFQKKSSDDIEFQFDIDGEDRCNVFDWEHYDPADDEPDYAVEIEEKEVL